MVCGQNWELICNGSVSSVCGVMGLERDWAEMLLSCALSLLDVPVR